MRMDMVTLHYTGETHYISNDRTVETIIVNGNEVVYEVYQDGYYSYCHGLDKLKKFLDGDTSARLICLDNPSLFKGICELFS